MNKNKNMQLSTTEKLRVYYRRIQSMKHQLDIETDIRLYGFYIRRYLELLENNPRIENHG